MIGLAAILLSLLLMILLIRRGWKLSLSIWTALPIMALISGLSWAETGEALRVAALSSVTHNLLLSILGIGLLGEMLYYNGSIERALQAIKKMIGDPRYIITALPAFIGLMPIPGGAYLSAPLVKWEKKLKYPRKTWLWQMFFTATYSIFSFPYTQH